jgi:hypothetical protein
MDSSEKIACSWTNLDVLRNHTVNKPRYRDHERKRGREDEEEDVRI